MTRRGRCTVCETGGGLEDQQTRWRVHGERQIYGSRWVEVSLIDVELPHGERFEHHVVRLPSAVAVVVLDDADRVLMNLASSVHL